MQRRKFKKKLLFAEVFKFLFSILFGLLPSRDGTCLVRIFATHPSSLEQLVFSQTIKKFWEDNVLLLIPPKMVVHPPNFLNDCSKTRNAWKGSKSWKLFTWTFSNTHHVAPLLEASGALFFFVSDTLSLSKSGKYHLLFWIWFKAFFCSQIWWKLSSQKLLLLAKLRSSKRGGKKQKQLSKFYCLFICSKLLRLLRLWPPGPQ